MSYCWVLIFHLIATGGEVGVLDVQQRGRREDGAVRCWPDRVDVPGSDQRRPDPRRVSRLEGGPGEHELVPGRVGAPRPPVDRGRRRHHHYRRLPRCLRFVFPFSFFLK